MPSMGMVTDASPGAELAGLGLAGGDGRISGANELAANAPTTNDPTIRLARENRRCGMAQPSEEHERRSRKNSQCAVANVTDAAPRNHQ